MWVFCNEQLNQSSKPPKRPAVTGSYSGHSPSPCSCSASTQRKGRLKISPPCELPQVTAPSQPQPLSPSIFRAAEIISTHLSRTESPVR